ncbi:hypothetical protein OXYTRIMIC_116 [Oxytricha trifallax]|uniref:Uncharacterized protein n=1 Tax=Oxytricha trifallax TaxID=1172189 RepID=A0A073IB30_9SPIT|nr:hypothetical protein OXYTRIMIC_116 [Oxytricha trifallax]
MLSEQDLDNPIQKCFEGRLEKHSKTKHWFNKHPKWAIRTNNQATNKSFQEAKEKWNEAIRNMEQCLEKNDVKGFFYLFKRVTKSRKYSEPIKGLTSNGERINLGKNLLRRSQHFTTNYIQMIGKNNIRKSNQGIK